MKSAAEKFKEKIQAIEYNKWNDRVEVNIYGYASTPWNNKHITRAEWELQGCE